MIVTLKRYFNNELIIHITFLLLCLMPVLLSFILITDGQITAIRFLGKLYRTGLFCIFKESTGYNCPSCGMTRAFIYMSRLNIRAALEMNRAGVLLYIFCMLQIIYRSFRIVRSNIPVPKFLFWSQAVFLILIGIVDLRDFFAQFI